MNGKMKEGGFTKIPDWSSCWFHKDLHVFVTAYVDDFLAAGSRKNLLKAWALIRKDVQLQEDPTSLNKYIGCFHSAIRTGTETRVTMQMRDYLKSAVEVFKADLPSGVQLNDC